MCVCVYMYILTFKREGYSKVTMERAHILEPKLERGGADGESRVCRPDECQEVLPLNLNSPSGGGREAHEKRE